MRRRMRESRALGTACERRLGRSRTRAVLQAGEAQGSGRWRRADDRWAGVGLARKDLGVTLQQSQPGLGGGGMQVSE